ncbi:MAG: HEPN domain-containing protein [Zestosphaera sp.]
MRVGLDYLLERSRRLYESALQQVERGFHDLAAFSLEQSLQPYLKASLLRLGGRLSYELTVLEGCLR